MKSRIEYLREQMLNAAHAEYRRELSHDVDLSESTLSIPEKRARAISYIFENMPTPILDGELIVGGRTLLFPVDSPECDPTVVPSGKHLLDLNTMPRYLSDEDITAFGGVDEPNSSGLHNVADYSIILKRGVSEMIKSAEYACLHAENEMRAAYSRGMVIAYKGFSKYISRYADEAARLSNHESRPIRKAELKKIESVCRRISSEPPRDFHEAAQLFWFAHLGVLIDNFRGMCYGRVDRFLYPFYDSNKKEEIDELVACLLIKMNDSCDLYHYLMGQYNSQHNITLGGVDPDGENAVNELTYSFIRGLDRVRLEEPEVACRINKKNPPEYLDMLTALSGSGLNTIAYYNDDIFISNLERAGIPLHDARDYAFDLCQDILIPGRCQLFTSGDVNLSRVLLDTMKKHPDCADFEEFKKHYKNHISEETEKVLSDYNTYEKRIRDYTSGAYGYALDGIPSDVKVKLAPELESPLSFTSGMFDGMLERGGDVNLLDYKFTEKGMMISGLTVAANSLSALRRQVFDSHRFTLSEVNEALSADFEGYEEMRQLLLSSPAWGNDDDYVDAPAVEIFEFTAREVMKHRTAAGVRHLAGYHQPHPVFAGWSLPATPDGRKARTPVPVSLSPAQGRMTRGATSAMRSVAKISPSLSEWNNCLMLEYPSNLYSENKYFLSSLIRGYFAIGGMQHQPNTVSKADLLAAQNDPDKYKNIIVRMWGVSARFVTLSREVQNEFISRL